MRGRARHGAPRGLEILIFGFVTDEFRLERGEPLEL
jgi:hypothetical protein